MRGPATRDFLTTAAATRATPEGARDQTEGSGVRLSGTLREASPAEKTAIGCREPAAHPVTGPTESPAPTGIDYPASPYERYAAVFSRVYADVHSIALALELLDTYRAREALIPPPEHDLPERALAIAASLFHVPAKLLLERNRRVDVTSARYVAAWVLRRRRWSYGKIAALFGLDHSTIIHGLRKVVTTSHLLLAALKTEHLVDGIAPPIPPW